MKTFYSILSAVINPISGENISLGLLLTDGNNSIFSYSKNRMSIIASLIDPETKKFMLNYLKSVENVIKKIDINEDQINIFEESGKNIFINESYISYLSNYSRNVISFSKPVSIDVPVNENIFENLFTRFIDDESSEKAAPKSDIQLVKIKFFPVLKPYFTTEKKISFQTEKKILLPVTIDLFGKNEIPVMGQFFDLEKGINHIKTDMFDFQQVASIYKKSKKFIISSEPDKQTQADKHHFWSSIRKQKALTYVDINEVEIIEQYAKEHNVVPQ